MKKSLTEDQILSLNRIDFERAGTARKSGYKFKIEFISGKVQNIISGSTLATHLAQVILEDQAARELLNEHDFEIHLNTKFQLIIKNLPKKIQQ